MRSLLLTMLDLRQEPNQRTQHVLAMLRGITRETVAVSKVKTLDRSPRAFLRDALTFHMRTTREENFTYIALDPLLNYAQAMAAGLVHGELARRPRPARRLLAVFLSLLGIFRDLLLVPSFIAAVLMKTSGRFDVCVAEGPWTGIAALVLRRLGRVRWVVYDDIDYVAGGQMLRLRAAYVAFLERHAIRRADRVVSAGYLLGAERARTCLRNVPVIPNGVDVRRFLSARDKRPHPPTLVYVGHLAFYCGIELAIRSLPEIRARVPGTRLMIVGDGDSPYVAGLHALADSLGMASAVEFRGRVPYDKVPELLAEADIGVATFQTSPLGRFAFPLKVVEYMAAGLPVLCTTDTEGEEILRRYPAGRAVTYTPQAFAAAASELLTDSRAYAVARATAIAAAEVLTWERAMDEQRALIADLLNQGAGDAAAAHRV